MKQPNFFIIGAPKCGTTSMAAWLGEHPQIFISDPKEPSFFSTDNDIPRGVKTLDKYLQIFQNAGDEHLAVGEASPTYLLSHDAVKNILEFNPAAKFIVMLRNPIEMAQSWHSQLIIMATWPVLDDFEEDWKARYASKFEPGKLDHQSRNTAYLQYDKICKLGEQVQLLLKTLDAKSVLFVVMDDLISDPLHEYQRVLEFLDVPYDGKKQFLIHGSARQPRYILIWYMLFYLLNIKRKLKIRRDFRWLRSIMNSVNLKPRKINPLRPEFKQELIEVFKEDVKLLSFLLGRDFSQWLR